jgi:hypothetical protein
MNWQPHSLRRVFGQEHQAKDNPAVDEAISSQSRGSVHFKLPNP